MNARGFAPGRLTRLDDAMTAHVASGAVPGVVALVSRHDDVHVDVVGTMKVGGTEPMRRDTIFRIASLTKPVAAVAAMILVEERKLRLDDAVDDFLPELANRRVLKRLDGPIDDTLAADRPITLRDLLTLRMGMGHLMQLSGHYPIEQAVRAQGFLLGPPRPQSGPDPDEWMRRLGTLPLMFQPGAQWMYDIAIDVLGVLIARATGQSLEAFLRDRIFDPLGMNDTAFSVPPEKLHRLATSYMPNAHTGALDVYDDAASSEWARPPRFQSASGGLVSTVDDYFAFGRMMLGMGRHRGVQILSRPSVELMTQDQLRPEQKATAHFFLGDDRGVGVWRRRGQAAKRLDRQPEQHGWTGGQGTCWASKPAEGLVGILLSLRAMTSPTPPPLFVDFWTATYQAFNDRKYFLPDVDPVSGRSSYP